MAARRYRAPPVDALVIVTLDDLMAVFHRASGITHLVTSPVAELLEALADRWMTVKAMEAEFGVVEGDRDGMAATLNELVDAGLVERA